MPLRSALVASAVAGLLGGLAACGSPAPSPKAPSTDVPATLEKNCCKGLNACKGQSGCKSDKSACAGQNACKGQGTSCPRSDG